MSFGSFGCVCVVEKGVGLRLTGLSWGDGHVSLHQSDLIPCNTGMSLSSPRSKENYLILS